MKPNRFSLLMAIFAIALIFLACSDDSSPETQGGEPSSSAAEPPNGGFSSSSSDASSNRTCAPNDLGKGYDVIGKPYPNWTAVGNTVLDQDKMCQDGILELDKPGSKQEYLFFSGSTVEELYSKRNESMKIGANLGVEIKIPFVFSAEVDVKFAKNTSNSSQESSSKKYFYSQMRSYRYIGEDQIKSGSGSARNLSKYLTSDFISDLKSTKSPGQILDIYGSHVFIHYFKGGSLEANYTYTGSNSASRITSAEQMELAVKGSAKKQLKVNAGIDVETNNSEEQAVNELENHLSFYYVAYGGKDLKASSDMSELAREYGDWVETIKENARIAGIEDFAKSFIPIWDLAQQVEGVTSTRINDLKSEFKKRAEAQGAKFPEADCTPDDNNSTHYCSNGFLKEYGSVTDGAGKTYKTVVIGTQTWMAQNLNYNVTGSKCRGTTLYTDSSFSENLGEWSISKYYLLEDKNTANCDKYGRLYDWSTAMALPSSCKEESSCTSQISAKHKGICPVNYHIPTTTDWDKLILFAGGEKTASKYLKATFGWDNCGSSSSYLSKCEDKYGFSALPGGVAHSPSGEFGFSEVVGSVGSWWSSTELINIYSYAASIRAMTSGSDGVEVSNDDMSELHSVRCVKD